VIYLRNAKKKHFITISMYFTPGWYKVKLTGPVVIAWQENILKQPLKTLLQNTQSPLDISYLWFCKLPRFWAVQKPCDVCYFVVW
jgi:hypothetical protein